MYKIKTMTTRHQCTTWSVVRTLRNWGVPNDYLNPSTSSMKMIVWNCEGNGNVAFQNHAYELHRRHCPQILIIVKPPIAEEQAQAVIDTLLYTHSRRVDPTGSSRGIWMLWNESNALKVDILTNSENVLYIVKQTDSLMHLRNEEPTWRLDNVVVV